MTPGIYVHLALFSTCNVNVPFIPVGSVSMSAGHGTNSGPIPVPLVTLAPANMRHGTRLIENGGAGGAAELRECYKLNIRHGPLWTLAQISTSSGRGQSSKTALHASVHAHWLIIMSRSIVSQACSCLLNIACAVPRQRRSFPGISSSPVMGPQASP